MLAGQRRRQHPPFLERHRASLHHSLPSQVLTVDRSGSPGVHPLTPNSAPGCLHILLRLFCCGFVEIDLKSCYRADLHLRRPSIKSRDCLNADNIQALFGSVATCVVYIWLSPALSNSWSVELKHWVLRSTNKVRALIKQGDNSSVRL